MSITSAVKVSRPETVATASLEKNRLSSAEVNQNCRELCKICLIESQKNFIFQ
jgi:hypothetical protein